MATSNKDSWVKNGISVLVMFVAGLAGFSVLAVVILIILISLGILPAI